MTLQMAAALGVALAVAALSGCAGQPTDRAQVTIYAAASLAPAFEQLADAFADAHPAVEVMPIVSDGSSTLATQLIQGAPGDVFASADEQTMREVGQAGLLVAGSSVFASNTLEIAVAPENPLGITGLDDLDDPEVTVVVCAPEVPCGAAARTLLSAAGVRVVAASEEQNVTAVATKVRLGEADAGLVYATDIRSADGQLAAVPIAGADTATNRYAIGVVGSGPKPPAEQFVDWVRSSEGQAILAEYGFGRP